MPPTRPTSPARPNRVARTAGLMLAAAGVAAGAFAAVLRFQPPVPPAVPAPPPPVSAVVADGGPDPQLTHGFGDGERPWVNSYEGGRLSNQFHADQYAHDPDGTVRVTNPTSRFYLTRGQLLVVTGRTGEMAFDRPADGGGTGLPSAMRAPDNGRLHDVVIRLFPSVGAARPTMTMHTDNVRFDNDTLRLYTEKIPATAAAAAVAADRVPVTIRGDDYEMDGTGLTLRWNGRDGRLHLLEIAHGRRLTILHPASMNKPATRPAATAPAAAAGPVGPALASADPNAAALALPADPPPTPPPPYRAVFDDDVRIVQGPTGAAGQTLGRGDVLTLDFFENESSPATRPVGTTRPLATTRPPAATQPLPTTAPTPAAATLPATQPVVTAATRPKASDEPVTIYWTGKLRVTPLETAPPMVPLDHGQAAVRLVGRPAVLTYAGAEAEAAVATYRTGDGAVQLAPSAARPTVRMAQPQKQLTVVARSVDYDPAVSVATILGPATLAVGEDGGRTMTATWADRGLLHVVNVGAEPAAVDHVDLSGDVRAADPRFSLDGRRLLLDLGTQPGKSSPQLRRLTAVGTVACKLLRPGEPDQGIDGDRLVVGLDDGAPRDVVADGRQVRAFDAQQALFADHLEATLLPKPTTRPTTGPAGEASVALDALYATGHVRAVLKNGSTAVADTLREATAADGRQSVELAAAAGAHVVDAKHDELVGSVIHVAPDRGVVVVDGPGTLHTAGKDGGGRPIDVSWTDGLTFDQAANTADVVGRVLVRSVGADGGVSTVVGDTAHIDLLDATPTAGAKVAAGDSMGAKKVRAITLLGHVHATSDLTVGTLVVRHAELMDVAKLVYTDADGTARVPGPGRMLVENHRPPAAGGPATSGRFGVMAVSWRDRLAYDTVADRVTFDGHVRVGFEQDADRPAAGGPVQMQSDEMVISMAKALGKEKPHVSDLVATGAVHCRAGTLDVTCHRADFRPDTGTLVATGSDAEPGHAVQAEGRGGSSADGGFSQLVFDTAKQEVVGGKDVTGTLRR